MMATLAFNEFIILRIVGMVGSTNLHPNQFYSEPCQTSTIFAKSPVLDLLQIVPRLYQVYLPQRSCLYVLVMPRTRFRVNPHAIVA